MPKTAQPFWRVFLFLGAVTADNLTQHFAPERSGGAKKQKGVSHKMKEALGAAIRK